MIHLGERIYQLRKALKLNQTDFAKRIGLESAVAISNYEKNNRKPDISTAIKIAKLGKVSLDWLLTGEGPREKKGLTMSLDQEYDKEVIKPGLIEQSQGGSAADGELKRLEYQLRRAYRGGNDQVKGKIQGFLAALDPGE